MSEPKALQDFPDVSVEDTVSVTLSAAADPNQVEFVLEADSNITWWKGLELRDSSGQLLEHEETQDANHGPRSFARGADELVGATLTLAKAKQWGIHTGMYELQNISAQRGQRLEFLWQRDDHRQGPVAGFFRDLGGGINSVADAIAGLVETVVNAVAEVAVDVIETIGHVIADVLEGIGNLLGNIPLVGGLLRGAFHWVANIVAEAFDFVAANIKGALNLLGGVIAGQIRVVGGAVGGLLSWDACVFMKGVGDIVSSIAGPVIMLLGKALAFVQKVVFVQWNERPLTKREHDILSRVYRGSVALFNIRIVEGSAGLFTLNDRPFTLGNTIYLKGSNPIAEPAVLVHECGHVWQNQHEGTRYVTDALWAQLRPSAYSWQDEIAGGHIRWIDFNKEAQAAFLEDVFKQGKRIPTTNVPGEFYDDDPVGKAVSFDSTELTEFARATVAYVRGTWPWRPSRWIG